MLSSCLKGGWLHFEDVSGEKSCRGQTPEEKQIREVSFSPSIESDLSFCLYIKAEGKEPAKMVQIQKKGHNSK